MDVKEFQERVKDNIISIAKLKPHDKILVGVSGGADSVALLVVLARLREELDMSLEAIHVEHGLRGRESLRDQDFVKMLCEKYEVNLVCKSAGQMIRENISSHLSLEEKARDARYELIQNEAREWHRRDPQGKVYIALAHHGNDNAETIIFNMIRGTGLDGMRGIPVKRGNIIRPMLSLTRRDIEIYLSDIKQHYRTDSTNLDPSYDRNNIRLNVIPVLNEINPKAIEHINNSAILLGEVAKYIRGEARDVLEDAICSDNYAGGEIDITEIMKQPDFMQREILHLWISKYILHAKDVTAKHLYDMQSLMGKQVGRRIDIPDDYQIVRSYKGLKIVKASDEALTEGHEAEEVFVSKEQIEANESITIQCQGKTYEIKRIQGSIGANVPSLNYTKWFDYDKIRDGISIRKACEGDYIQVMSQGGTQSFAKYCKNAKIPQEMRRNIPLVCDEHHILWAVGYRISEKYKITSDTRTVLEIHAMEEKINE